MTAQNQHMGAAFVGYDLRIPGVKADNGTTDNGPIITAALAGLTNGGVAWLPGGQAQKYECNSPVILPTSGIRLVGAGMFAPAGGPSNANLSYGPNWPTPTISGNQTTPASASTTFTLTLSSSVAAAKLPLGSTGISLAHGVGVVAVAGSTKPVCIYYTGVSGATLTGCTCNDVSALLPNGATVTMPLVWLGEPGLAAEVQGTTIENMQIGGTAGMCHLFSCRLGEGSGFDGINFVNTSLLGARFQAPSGASGTNAARNFLCKKFNVFFSATATTVAVGVDLYDTALSPSQRGISDGTIVTNSGSAQTVLAGVRLNGATGVYSGLHFENIPTGLLIGDEIATGPVEVTNITGQPGHMTTLVQVGNHAGTIMNAFGVEWQQAPGGAQVSLSDQLNGNSVTDQKVGYYLLDSQGEVFTDASTATVNLRGGGGGVSLPITESDVTNLTADLAAKAAQTAFGGYGGAYLIAPHTYATMPLSLGSNAGLVNSLTSGDARFVRILVPESGHLRDLSVLIQTTQATTNMNLLILDTGQAAVGTTRTCLWIGTPAQVPAANAWFTLDPNLAVNAGDTIDLCCTVAGTSAKVCAALGNAGSTSLPTTRMAPSSGAGTTSQKMAGVIGAAHVPSSVSGTVTDANVTASQQTVLFVFAIS